MHVTYNVKLIDSQQERGNHKYKNIKEKLYKCKAAVLYNKTCSLKSLILCYSTNIRMRYTVYGMMLLMMDW